MKNWKKFVAGVIVGAVVSLALAWGIYGNSEYGQGKFKKFNPMSNISQIKVIKSTR